MLYRRQETPEVWHSGTPNNPLVGTPYKMPNFIFHPHPKTTPESLQVSYRPSEANDHSNMSHLDHLQVDDISVIDHSNRVSISASEYHPFINGSQL